MFTALRTTTMSLSLLSLSFMSPFSAAANEESPPVPPALTLEVTNQESETLLADSIGKTLYVFDIDLGQSSSRCQGECAEIWPPYLISQAESQNLQAPLGFILRPNRQVQLTFKGRPVYTYAFDRIRGDELGDGVGGVWHDIVIRESVAK